MPRYRTVAEWVRLSTGERHQPGDVVELTEEQAAGLIRAGCLVLADAEAEASHGSGSASNAEGDAQGAGPTESAEASKPKSHKRR